MNTNVDGMNKPSPTSGSNTPSANDSDQDFDPSAEMLINDFDDEHTLEEEEAIDDNSNITNEISDLKKEGEMPIEELLALYGYQQSGNNKTDKSSQESSQRISTNSGDNNDSNCSEVVNTIANASQDQQQQVNQSSSTNAAGTYSTTTRSSKHLEELSSQWSLPATAVPLTNTNLLIDQEGSDMEDDEEEEEEDDDEDDEDDGDYEEGEGDWRRTIQVGSDYQAMIPEGLNGYGNVPPYENEDKLLWDAYVLTEDIVVNFLRQIASLDTTDNSELLGLSSSSSNNKSSDPTSAPSSTSMTQSTPLRETTNLPLTNSIRDDEVALYLLHQCGHNVEEALRRKRMQQNSPFETMSPWSEEECINFEDGIKAYGKDFHQIQKNKVSTRSVGELVQFYYLWKKTERHDMYASKWRVEKKKYSLHPGTTDYMDRFIDEQENLALQAHSMNMSTSNYTRHQSHGSYSIIHYNHNSSGGTVTGGGGQQQSSNSSTFPTSNKETTSAPESSTDSPGIQSNGNTVNVATTKSNNCITSNATSVSSTTPSPSLPSTTITTPLSSSSTSTTTTATNNNVNSSSPNNGPESLHSNVGTSDTLTESLNSGITRENVQNNSSNNNPSKNSSAPDLFSPLTKMRMDIVDG